MSNAEFLQLYMDMAEARAEKNWMIMTNPAIYYPFFVEDWKKLTIEIAEICLEYIP